MEIGEHGGGVCGVRHIYQMDHSSPADLDRIMENFLEDGRRTRSNILKEIVLSARQVAAPNGNGRLSMQDCNPAGGWVQALNARGFRLVSRFKNSNSDNECFVFHHVPQFLSLNPQDMPGDMANWVHDYEVPGADTMGVRREQMIPVVPRPALTGEIVVGSRVRRTSGFVVPRGTEGTVERPYRTAGGQILGWYVRYDNGLSPANLDDQGYTSSQHLELIAPEPVNEAPRVLLSTYHNVYRRSGRSACGWDNYDLAAERVNGRINRQIDRRDVMSDGGIIWVEGVTA